MENETALPHTDDFDDIAQISRYLKGDPSAFDPIFSRYHARIRALCLRYVNDEALADDLVQETFYNVLRSLTRVDAEFNFSAWIHRIAVNLCQDELRRRRRASRHIEVSSSDAETDAVLRLVDPDSNARPEQALEMAQLRRVVWDVGKQLPERQRMVLTLRELQGLSYSAIARVMGISDAAVETLLHRARRRFKDIFLAMESPVEEGPGPGRDGCPTAAGLLGAGRGRLDAEQLRALRAHAAGCDACRALLPLVDFQTAPSAR